MSRTLLSAYEYQRVPFPPGLDVAALERFADSTRERYFSVGRRHIVFNHHVGYLQVGRIAIEVLPKADRGGAQGTERRWKRVLLAMLEVTTGLDLHSPTDATQAVDRATLLELLSGAFVREVATILRQGLARAYRTEESNGTTLRGRLLMTEHVRENAVRADRFYVRFATFDGDIVVNRILAETLRVIRDLPVSAGLRARAAEQGARFESFAPIELRSRLFERLTLGRSTARYERALGLARMILEEVAPALVSGRTNVFALMFDMNRLWEEFVAALFRRAAVPGLEVHTQTSRVFWRAEPGRRKMVRPDLLVRDAATGEVLLVVDTKWKVPLDGVPSDDDLKQMFVYNELFRSRTAVLLYPAASPEVASLRGRYGVDEAHTCETAYLGLFDGEELRTSAMAADVKAMLVAARPRGGDERNASTLRQAAVRGADRAGQEEDRVPDVEARPPG